MIKEIPLEFATRLINHGPVVLVSSISCGRVGITPVAWNMPAQKKPPMVILEIGAKHFIRQCILDQGDFVVNIPPRTMASEVVGCGTCSGREVDKLSKFDLVAAKSEKVMSPGVEGCLAYLECELIRDASSLDEHDLVLAKVVYARAEEEAFSEHWLFKKEEHCTLHHLGNKVFCSPGGDLIDLR